MITESMVDQFFWNGRCVGSNWRIKIHKYCTIYSIYFFIFTTQTILRDTTSLADNQRGGATTVRVVVVGRSRETQSVQRKDISYRREVSFE